MNNKLRQLILIPLLATVALMALAACGGSGPGPATPPPQSGPLATATLSGIPTPAITPTPLTRYCPPPTADGHERLCVVVEPTPGPATRAVYATRLAEWEALGTPTSPAWATADAYTTALAAEIATALYTPAPGGAPAP